jgi:hypothetical protein
MNISGATTSSPLKNSFSNVQQRLITWPVLDVWALSG